MHTNSMGAEVQLLSKGARATGSGVFARIHRWQHFTYSLMSLSICGQKKRCLAGVGFWLALDALRDHGHQKGP